MKVILAPIKYIAWGILVGLDKILNVCLLGSIHQTLSMRLSFCLFCRFVEPRYFWVKWLGALVDIMFWPVEKYHIFKNYEATEVLNEPFWKWYRVTNPTKFAEMRLTIQRATKLGRARPAHERI